MDSKQLEECISARSHLLWEREGRPAGQESEYLERARAEIEEALRLALQGDETNFVPPRFAISMRPVRHPE
ncbi:hypothetical protein FHS83_003638 [Rhizomicrobium palustre]|jgi:hypothetical protein|uniref:DUF2934 domain-containing protein n=1 Tax=Rhizomicrobium palustre TaxID=189966 RepID=A0A846N5P8_9PROT|nr:DUF2934 domain-containing protein [Rhizomicrobium palustre]NIK90320.1 hypothetical protein [Rhizomicrobium palustre]